MHPYNERRICTSVSMQGKEVCANSCSTLRLCMICDFYCDETFKGGQSKLKWVPPLFYLSFILFPLWLLSLPLVFSPSFSQALNKLDAGVPEKILLVSRDERSLLVVSYRDLKKCMEGAYAELEAKGIAALTSTV